jgi:hypothetical protein
MQLPASERPLCPYEQSEYDAIVADLDTHANADVNPLARHLVHHVALLSVMVSRASRALAMKPLTEKFEQTANDYHLAMEKPSAQLIAFEKLSRELRHWVRLFNQQHPPRTHVTPSPPVDRPRMDDVCDEEESGIDEDAWELVQTQQTLIEDLYRQLRASADSHGQDARATCDSGEGGSGFQPEREASASGTHPTTNIALPGSLGRDAPATSASGQHDPSTATPNPPGPAP